jgi:hexosaminidase
VRPVTKVSANFLKQVPYRIFPPTSVEIALSRDGNDFKEAIAQPVNMPLNGPWAVVPIVADFRTARARYVRLKAKNLGQTPDGHPRPGQTSLQMDEVIVE